MNEPAKLFILLGVILIGIGICMYAAPKIPFLGKLPGDIYIKKDNFNFYFPLATSLLLSVVLTVILNLFGRK